MSSTHQCNMSTKTHFIDIFQKVRPATGLVIKLVLYPVTPANTQSAQALEPGLSFGFRLSPE